MAARSAINPLTKEIKQKKTASKSHGKVNPPKKKVSSYRSRRFPSRDTLKRKGKAPKT